MDWGGRTWETEGVLSGHVGDSDWGGREALSQLGGEKSHRLGLFLCQPSIPSVLVTG